MINVFVLLQASLISRDFCLSIMDQVSLQLKFPTAVCSVCTASQVAIFLQLLVLKSQSS